MTGEGKVLLGIGVVTLALFIGGIVSLTRNNSSNVPQVADPAVLVKADSNTTGAAAPKVTLFEFGDFQCPFCAQAHLIIKDLVAAHPEELLFVARNYPLSQHLNAQLAAEAAEAAGEQGKYWEMYDLLYSRQADWSESKEAQAVFEGYAAQLTLNVDQFKQTLSDDTYLPKIQQDMVDGNSLGVNSTPTFFLDNERFSGSLDQLKTLIESKLQ